jgi:dTDP-L-rhamnose 4-epimerase
MEQDKILITGGLGFIGMEVARLLVEQKRRVLLFDNLSTQIHGMLPDFSARTFLRQAEVEVVRGNVSERGVWAKTLVDVRCVVHLAAETGTAQSMYEISRYAETNVGGTASLLDYLANHKHNVAKVVVASSRSVYGEGAYMCEQCGLVYPPMRSELMFRTQQWEPLCPNCRGAINSAATPESAETTPASIYAATKLAQEHLVRITSQALGIPAVIFRFQNVYGEGQSLRNPYTGILSIFSNQLRQGRSINLYEDAQESRDFVHVADVARAVLLALDSSRADGHTLNVGSGRPTSIATIAALLQERIGGGPPARVSGQYRLGDVRHGYADTSRISEQLGFAPEIPLEEGLDHFVDWVCSQPVEPDLLGQASEELAARGLMQRDVDAVAV